MVDTKKHSNKIKKAYTLKEGEKAKFNISLDKNAVKSFETLKAEIGQRTLSGTITFLLQFAINNLELLKTVNMPGNQIQSLESINALVNQIIQQRPNEINESEQRLLQLELANQEINNKLDKLLKLKEQEDPVSFNKVKSEMNGLGGKKQ